MEEEEDKVKEDSSKLKILWHGFLSSIRIEFKKEKMGLMMRHIRPQTRVFRVNFCNVVQYKTRRIE